MTEGHKPSAISLGLTVILCVFLVCPIGFTFLRLRGMIVQASTIGPLIAVYAFAFGAWLALVAGLGRRIMRGDARATVAAAASGLAIAAAAVLLPLGDELSDWERLDQLGLSLEGYRNSPIDLQLQTFLDVADYGSTYPDPALEQMAEAIGHRGQESVEPVVWTIRALLPIAEAGNPMAHNVLVELPKALLVAAREGAVAEVAAYERLVVTLACNPTLERHRSPFATSLLELVHPEILLGDAPPPTHGDLLCLEVWQ